MLQQPQTVHFWLS